MDKSPVVASAALVSALHLLAANGEIVKRWVNEVQEAVQSKDHHVQFHAVALLHALRANDRLAISKLVTSLTKANVKSALAQVLLVRYVAQVSVAVFENWVIESLEMKSAAYSVAHRCSVRMLRTVSTVYSNVLVLYWDCSGNKGPANGIQLSCAASVRHNACCMKQTPCPTAALKRYRYINRPLDWDHRRMLCAVAGVGCRVGVRAEST